MSKSHPSNKSSVLVFAGLDPTGGAGISADIETLANLKVHALPVVTCLTVQDTLNVRQLNSVNIQLLKQQIETLQQDISFQAIKLGLLSSIEIVNLVADTLKAQPGIPVVFDPVIRAGGGANLTVNDTDSLIVAMCEKIMPYTTLITPNSLEARLLTDEKELDYCATVLHESGCENILITGEHENNPEKITNTLYSVNTQGHLTHKNYHWPRLPFQYHGSGCTLASAISALLARGLGLEEAVQQAQYFTHLTLQHATQLGKGQYHPNRFIDNKID